MLESLQKIAVKLILRMDLVEGRHVSCKNVNGIQLYLKRQSLKEINRLRNVYSPNQPTKFCICG